MRNLSRTWAPGHSDAEQVLGLRQIGIEFQQARDVVARPIDLPGFTQHTRDILPNAALSRRARE